MNRFILDQCGVVEEKLGYRKVALGRQEALPYSTVRSWHRNRKQRVSRMWIWGETGPGSRTANAKPCVIEEKNGSMCLDWDEWKGSHITEETLTACLESHTFCYNLKSKTTVTHCHYILLYSKRRSSRGPSSLGSAQIYLLELQPLPWRSAHNEGFQTPPAAGGELSLGRGGSWE